MRSEEEGAQLWDDFMYLVITEPEKNMKYLFAVTYEMMGLHFLAQWVLNEEE